MSWVQDAATGALTNIDRAIPPDVLRAYLRRQKPYVLYRRRTAAGLQQGLDTYDTYLRWRPTIFWTSLAVTVASAAAGWARRKQGPEAWLVYATTGTLGAVTAYVTRPTSPTATAVREAEEAAEEAGAAAPNPVFAYLDAKAAEYERRDPQFPESTFRRIVSLPGMREPYESLPALAKAAIV